MELNYSSEHVGGICVGCLSVERVLKPVFDSEIKEYFQNIIKPLPFVSQQDRHESHPLLCWECVAVIRRSIRFHRQVKSAHEKLIQFQFEYSKDISCLSRLSTHTIDPVSLSEDLDSQPQLLGQEVEPLAFIKVEEPDEDGGDDLGCYGGESDGVNELKTEINTDPITYKEEKTKHKRKRKRKKEEEFDESDDEPLKKRTEEKIETEHLEVNPRGRRKKKETEPTTKKRKGKREKPSGVVDDPRVARRLERLGVQSGALQMVMLTWEQVEEERQKALASESYTRHAHRCQRCALGFNHRAKLQCHMDKHDPAVGPLECGACGVRAREPRALAAHRRRHRTRWRCVTCGQMWSRAEVAADHLARDHGAAPPSHACPQCNHTAPSLGKLRNHMKSHEQRRECELCAKTFRDRASLRTHLFIHKGEKEYSCPRCGKLFLFKKALELHLVTHDAPALLYCHMCDENFKNRITYYQHMKYNLKHIDPAMLKHECPTCGKRFAKAARLREHELAVHLKVTPIACTFEGCSFACASRPVLRTHVRMVHRAVRARRDHVCHTCGKAYATKKSLEGHMRSHSGERPFACALCAWTFAHEAALYNHNRLVHLKDKTGRRVAPRPAQAPAWPLAPPIDTAETTLPR